MTNTADRGERRGGGKEGDAGNKVAASRLGNSGPSELSLKNIRGPVWSIPERVCKSQLGSLFALLPLHRPLSILHLYLLFPWSIFVCYSSRTNSCVLKKASPAPCQARWPPHPLIPPVPCGRGSRQHCTERAWLMGKGCLCSFVGQPNYLITDITLIFRQQCYTRKKVCDCY